MGGKSKVNGLLQKIGMPPLFKDKRNYVDYENWMRDNKELREYIYDTILSDRALNRGYFNPDFIRKLIDEHMSGKKNNTQLIGLLLTFELFNRMFIDGEKI
jgi:asparagine synthase (glutamine-hydrolysing)